MDKNAIKKYAVWARRELISRVSGQAAWYGITEDNIVDADAASIDGRVLSAAEKKQRVAFISKVQHEGYKQAVEEVAYTWFNRFCALRYMEVNGYLPSHVRIFTDDANKFKPQILDEAIHLEIEGLDKEKVLTYKDINDTEGLYRYLLITQCNALSSILPGMFPKIEDYTELLLPENLLREGSVIERMIVEIPEEDWTDQVQIIGWLYQYYNAGKKDEVFAALKKNVKITKENVPAATQLFTPDWIVRYMVENSLGRLWIEGHPNNELKSNWKYYLDEAEQLPEVEEQLTEIRKGYAILNPEDVKCIDPCCGSGHILVYMFDVLMQIYKSYGYTVQEAVTSIITNNLYGLDIDERAIQLAYFAVMMKARSYDSRFFSRKIQPQVYAICESNDLDKSLVDYYEGNDSKIKENFKTLLSDLYDAKEYGSILKISNVDFEVLYARAAELSNDISFYAPMIVEQILPLILVGELLAQKYYVVVTNPPYMGASDMDTKLSSFIKENYPDSKSDLFAIFIEHCRHIIKENGYLAMITQHTWMFLSSYEKLRIKLMHSDILNMLHLGPHAFEEIGGEVVQTTSFIIRKSHVCGYIGKYYRLIEPTTQQGKENMFLARENQYNAQQDAFSKIPGMPVAYWISESTSQAFTKNNLFSYGTTKQGLATADNNRFLRLWTEVSIEKATYSDCCKQKKWFPYNKGGPFRKWYGNNEYLINWENDGFEIKAFQKSVIRNSSFYFKEGITWSDITSGFFSARYTKGDFIFDGSGPMYFATDRNNLFMILANMNSKPAMYFFTLLAPTFHFREGPVGNLPCLLSEKSGQIAKDATFISKMDWDSFETSWDFKCHPLIRWGKKLFDTTSISATMKHYYGYLPKTDSPLELSFLLWQGECKDRFKKLKVDEEEINRIFINLFGLQDELTPDVEDKDITVRNADLQRDIKSLISYAVGCMFGRYSLDIEGIAYAGGDWDESKYQTYMPDHNGILPICDDEYFTDDIVGRFVDFIRTVYGEGTLEENLQFIADTLGGKGSSREVIRKYFLNDFFADHCKIYQKRPIYWLFDSGKKNGFKCLIYLHRYRPDTIARIRTDYVHEQQARYRTAIADLENRIETASTSDRIKLNKEMKKIQEQADELHDYEEKIHHLADQYIDIDLDDGVKVNYAKFQDVLAKIK